MNNVLSTLNNPLSNFCLWNVLNKRPPHQDERGGIRNLSQKIHLKQNVFLKLMLYNWPGPGTQKLAFYVLLRLFVVGRDEIITVGHELSQWLLVNLVKLRETIKKI